VNKPCTIWLTGLSGSGKSTFANSLKHKLESESLPCAILDGDIVRKGLCSDLTYTPRDRAENNRRIAEVAKFLNAAGMYTICALISPMQKDREQAKAIIGEPNFKEVFLNTPLSICESRDPKGLYKKARKNEIQQFTGISAPYEEPRNPALIIDHKLSSLEAVDLAYNILILSN